MTASPSGADRLLALLAHHGVTTVFGVPGDTNVAFYAAFADSPVRHVMARDERSAGFMADAFARVSGRCGVVEVPSGAGPMYALPAVAEAQRSAVPLLLLTFETALSAERRGIISELDCASLLRPITKDSWQLKAPHLLGEAVRRAFRIAHEGRAGAVHLAIPDDLLSEDTGADVHAPRSVPQRPVPSPDSVAALRSLLEAAERPVLIAGGGVCRASAEAALRDFAEAWALPVATSLTGQGSLADRHPLNIGVVGDNGYHPHAVEAVEAADLVVFAGSALGSTLTMGWRFPSRSPGRRIVHVDIDGTMLGNAFDPDLAIHGDVGALFHACRPHGSPPPHRVWAGACAQAAEATRAADRAALASGAVPLWPERVMAALQPHVAGRTLLVADPGTSTAYAARFLALGEGSHRIVPRGFGGLGYAIPGVVGAHLADPEATLVGLFGDGSFAMSVGELETLARLNVPARLIYFSNGSFGLIKAIQRQRAPNNVSGVDFTQLDAARIAEGFGLTAFRATTPDELDAAVNAAFAHDGPIFVDVVVEDISAVVPPMHGFVRKAGLDPLARDRTVRRPLVPGGSP